MGNLYGELWAVNCVKNFLVHFLRSTNTKVPINLHIYCFPVFVYIYFIRMVVRKIFCIDYSKNWATLFAKKTLNNGDTIIVEQAEWKDISLVTRYFFIYL